MIAQGLSEAEKKAMFYGDDRPAELVPFAEVHPDCREIGMASGKKAATGAATVWLIFASAALAQEGTYEQREACTSDAFRLCGQYIPNADAVKVCLQNSGSRLSPPCYAVFHPSRAEAAPRNSRRHYIAPRRDDDDD